jgi:hypothetical protein
MATAIRFMVMKNIAPLHKALFAISLIVSSWSFSHEAYAQMTSSSTDPVLPDPVPNKGADYPPSAVTADTAYGGPAKMKSNAQCSALNPCAVSSSEPHKLGPLVNGSTN